MTFGFFGSLEGGGILQLTLTTELRSEAYRALMISFSSLHNGVDAYSLAF
jgi:hypothetical protein